jgi:hypothetical protein
MPSFLDKMRSGAERAAFEADRLRRVNQAKSALRALERDLEGQVAGMGQQALALYDAGNLTQPELLASCGSIETLRQQIQEQAAEVERIRQEEPPSSEEDRAAAAPAAASETPAQVPVAAVEGPTCANCHSPLPADARFCQECGARVEDS